MGHKIEQLVIAQAERLLSWTPNTSTTNSMEHLTVMLSKMINSMLAKSSRKGAHKIAAVLWVIQELIRQPFGGQVNLKSEKFQHRV